MKVLITGVTGMDGSYMVDYLLENTNYEIYGMIRRTAKPDYSNLNSSIKNPRFKLVVGDLSDSHSIDSLVKDIKPDYFINLAAQSFVGSSWQIPEQTFDIDATGVIRCLEAVRKHVPLCRFYNAGSSEEVGDVDYSPQDIKHPPKARSPYGAAKIAARQILKVYRESYGLYAIQGMLYNHEGERRGEEFVTRKITKGVARIFHAIRNKEKFEPIVLGNLEAKRDWSYAPDFVDGIWRMMNQELHVPYLKEIADNLDETYNSWTHDILPNIKEYLLASGETHSIREFIELAFKRAGIKLDNCNPECSPIEEGRVRQINYQNEEGWPVVVVSREFYRPIDVDLLIGDSTPARTELGWCPKVTFNQLVEKMIDADILNFPLTKK
jgi:GDPmannose 4,6-dehydratase